MHNTLYPNGYIDITQIADTKLELLQSYRSQNEIWRFDHRTMGMCAWNCRFLPGYSEALYVEIFMTLPKEEHFRLIKTFYFRDFEATYRGHNQVIKAAKHINQVTVCY